MQEISLDVLKDPFKFELIMIPCSCYQKKNGEVAVMPNSFLDELIKKAPTLRTEIGKAVERYGNCPAVLSAIPGSPIPTKFCTFPISPSNLRAEDPDDYVFHRLKGKFKKYSLLPGWTLLPRIDMVEFSAIKLREIIKYFRLTKIVLQYESFTLDKEDKMHYTKIQNIMQRYLQESFYVAHMPKENIEVKNQVTATSSVTFEE